ncbi:MAG: hypothetical protein A3G18_11910 [Rhodospirillales bacterium RIFCSPLOWO2_12_FULL_58_28]|nr:MAG: hypothetical protein A3H92_12100 [Rhodospirillales bacterium RIFCSPLOWO2_02_FULL_58_16]OHC77516.1 MAG: hypothetical protein A3G18_11910 [Rhodospirillales bacterium RIFCSPLOWO2_12_FULL_58_28]
MTAAVIAAPVYAMSSFSAMAAECAEFPQVDWWGPMSHERVTTYVKVKHKGDWADYTEKWERQLALAQGAGGKGTSLVTPNGATIAGPALSEYIGKLQKRIDVTKCLAEEDKKGGAAATPFAPSAADSSSQTGPGAAKAKAAGCTGCHGVDGMSAQPSTPHLAGQREMYMVKRMMEFKKSGEHGVSKPDISTEAEALSFKDIQEISAFFAAQ